ncbi:Hypothetical predicted protein [Mytilus galloprovincialis]|uniref:Integrase p58-like C-terminal domain-containing protein n=1 Tax=Mytilus galloprovincialis TaxID=29158 RepID=A0A8B6FF25_MYTGA|nr:Hypothetical predicted protein [Mytilus galloprovincialis]
MILDNTSQSFKNKGVLVAKSICTFKGDNLPLRVMNLTDLPQTLYKNTCAGTAETICSENILGNINAEPELVLPEHMQVVMEKCKSNLKTDQCKIVVDLLTKYSGAFAMSKNDLGRTDIIQHKINTGNAHPIKQNPRRVPLAQRKEVDEEIQRMLDGGIIRHSQSPWSSPIVVVRKKDQDVTEVSFQIENPTIRAINMLDENEIEETPIVTNWFNNKTPDEFKQAQLDDPIISQILTWKKSPEKPKWPEISHLSQHHKTYWSQWERLTVVEGILYRKWENTTTNDINLQSSVHETLGETPCFMMMGREVRLPVDLIYGGACGINLNKYSVTNYVDKLSYKLEKVHEEVRDRLVSASERQKRRYDLSCTFPTFKVGDGVLLHDPRKYKGRSPKFQMRWSGPFTVIKVLSDVLYKIQEGPKVKFKVVHVNRLKPFQGNMKRWYQPVGEPAQNTRFQVRNKLDREQTDHD